MKRLWKKHKLLLIGVPVLLAAAAAVFIGYLRIQRTVKVREHIETANRYLSEMDYEQAIASYRQALNLDKENREASLGLAEAYDAGDMGVYAESVYLGMLENDSRQADVYEKLAELYMSENKLDEAKELLERAVQEVDDAAVTELYNVTRPQPPVSSVGSGAYTERPQVELRPAEKGQTIYYTLDGTEPTDNSLPYEEPFVLRNGKTTVKAIAVNSAGYQSDIAAWDYDVQIRDVEVELAEPVIEQIIRSTLSLPDDSRIYNDDIAQITELYIVGDSVSAGTDAQSVYMKQQSYLVDGYEREVYGYGQVYVLSDLQYMPFLKRVAVEYQPELDISALSGCGGIQELSLVGDHLDNSDIKALEKNTGLIRLNLGWNEISDISGLSDLDNLVSLSLWGNQITDLSPAAGLTKLEYLDFSDNQVRDITPIAGLTELNQLWMYGNQVSDIRILSGLEKLQVLMIRDNPVANPEMVRAIYPNLIRLDVDLLGLGGER